MQPAEKKFHYLLIIVFWFIGLFFLLTGVWGIGSSLAAEALMTNDIIAFVFLSLFAAVAFIYGFFIIRDIKDAAVKEKPQRILSRISPTKVLSLLVFGIAPILLVYLNSDMREFNRERETAFQKIRPAFLQYVADHSTTPRTLRMLVPEYISKIPDILQPKDEVPASKRVDYAATKNTARFYFKTSWRPDSKTQYDILQDRYLNKAK